jgi:ubiquitin carboxyl-terminal hydrolase 5/13
MASVIQTVFTFPSFTERYSKFGNEHILGCDLIPADCFHCQMTKLCNGLLSGRYSVPAAKDSTDRSQDGISPSMFKALIGKNHAEFSTMRQQDAMEFFEHFMSVTEQQERRFAKDPTSVLKFTMEEKLQCLTCNKVRYKDVPEQILSLFVPLKRKKGVIADAKTPDVEVYESVSFNECLKLYFDGSINEGYTCPSCQQASFARM